MTEKKIKLSTEDLMKEAKLLAKRNWKLICDLQEVPIEEKWFKFGLWEYDETLRCYKKLLWSEVALSEEGLNNLKERFSNEDKEKE